MSTNLRLIAGDIVFDWWGDEPTTFVFRNVELEIHAWGYDSELYALKPEPDDPKVFFFQDNGNDRTTEDKTGLELYALSLDRVIEAMENDCYDLHGINSSYALDCLRGLREFAEKNHRDVRVVLFFH